MDVPVCKDGTSNYSCCSSRSQQGVHHCHSSRHNHVCPWLFRSWSFQNQLCIHVSDDQKHVMLWHIGDCLLQLFVPVFLVLYVRFIGWGVTQNDCKLAVFGVEACFQYPITESRNRTMLQMGSSKVVYWLPCSSPSSYQQCSTRLSETWGMASTYNPDRAVTYSTSHTSERRPILLGS